MEKNGSGEYLPSQRRSNKQIIVLGQLLQASTGMQHIDDMFSWLTGTMVGQLDVQLVQLWSKQAFADGQLSIVLRANASEERSLPQNIFYNAHLVEIVGNLFRGRQGIALQPVQHFFSPYQTNLFQRYGLNYCYGFFLESEDLLPAPLAIPSGVATQFAMSVLFFMRNVPAPETIVAINQILMQLVPIARQRRLIDAPVARPTMPGPGSSPSQLSPSLYLASLVPRRLKDLDAMRASNPFASVNLDKNTMRIYQAIDGRKTIAEISALITYNEKEMLAILKKLYQQKLIDARDRAGKVVDLSQFF